MGSYKVGNELRFPSLDTCKSGPVPELIAWRAPYFISVSYFFYFQFAIVHSWFLKIFTGWITVAFEGYFSRSVGCLRSFEIFEVTKIYISVMFILSRILFMNLVTVWLSLICLNFLWSYKYSIIFNFFHHKMIFCICVVTNTAYKLCNCLIQIIFYVIFIYFQISCDNFSYLIFLFVINYFILD